MDSINELLKEKLTAENYSRLMALANAKLHAFVAEAIELTGAESVYVCTDSPEDRAYIRHQAIEKDEEIALNIKGHTCHFDGYYDQGRDKGVTKYLLPAGSDLGASLNSIDKKQGTEEIRGLLKGSMVGRQMLVMFFCLGPVDSEFSIPCVQITDSPYVGHSETILYRPGYEYFKEIGDSPDFFRFLHSEGELEGAVSKNVDKKRIYIDLEENMVCSVNTQYGGNTIGLKKLALRLAIQKASKEGWLAEHMFVMGACGPRGRITYFAGAFPSACGKTSTSMLPGQTIIGDDIAYFRRKDGVMRSVNVEKGIFGIIQDVNPHDDPVIYEALTQPGEAIFSNVLLDGENRPHWLGMGSNLPSEGVNHSGQWHKGKQGPDGNEVTASHKNARYCLNISDLKNMDPRMDDPEGVPVGGIIYGGRDSDIWVPVEQAFNWSEGIILKGASLESETTAATLGSEGVRTFNLMSNLDFLSIPLGRYIRNNLDFADGIENPPLVFSVNYFLKDKKGKYLNGMGDKLVWILWAELRVNGDVEGMRTPTGIIPKHKDLAKLFKEKLGAEFTQADYVRQFTFRIRENLAKLDRVEKIYKEKVADAPEILYRTFAEARKRLKAAAEEHGDNISPLDLPSE
ncbi:MAG TPA: phosphoenolpyruvate carboxykinase (GTP) [Sedimentisphaerales bacterium]|nr:phosphoenolpyruvate carboxykinase (GTP) [Sedimentisphaerales bacterium]